MTSTSRVVHSDPDILGGTPVFIGTRVPIKTLLDYLEAGDSLDEFLDHFPSVKREQAIALCNNSILFVKNQFQPRDMIRVTFSVTRDLNAIFPDAIAKPRSDWDCSRDARYTP